MDNIKDWLPIILQALAYVLAVLCLGYQQSKDRRVAVAEIRKEATAAGEASGKLSQIVETLEDTADMLNKNMDRMQIKFEAGFGALDKKIKDVDGKVGGLSERVAVNTTRIGMVEDDVKEIKKKVS